MRKFLCVFLCVFLWSESATTLRQDWTNTCVLEPCKNDASEREERKSPNPGKRSAKRSIRVYAANCDCVTCLSKLKHDLHFHRCSLFKSGTNFCTGDFAPPKPEFGAEFWETNFGRPNFGPEFLGRIFWLCFFQQKRPPEKFTLEKFTFQNSPSKIQPRNRAKKFTLHLCRAIWLSLSADSSALSSSKKSGETNLMYSAKTGVVYKLWRLF